MYYLYGWQINTKDILFVCGGAFVTLDKIVAERTSESSLGFGNPVRARIPSGRVPPHPPPPPPCPAPRASQLRCLSLTFACMARL